jgi:hypothetical protein
MYEFNLTYTQWIFHNEEDQFRVNTYANVHTVASETIEEVDVVEELYDNVCMGTFLDANIGESSTSQGPTTGASEDINSFYRRLEDGLRELYPGCKKFTKIAFKLKMLHIKAICNISHKAFNMMIDLIKKALLDGETLSTSYKEAMRLRRDLGFNYENIHACKNDVCFFGRNMQIQWNAQNAKLLDGVLTKAEKRKYLKKSYSTSQ